MGKGQFQEAESKNLGLETARPGLNKKSHIGWGKKVSAASLSLSLSLSYSLYIDTINIYVCIFPCLFPSLSPALSSDSV